MNKFKYLKISKSKQIRYLDNNFPERIYIVFLHGFMSNIEGEKPKTIFDYAKKKSLVSLLLSILVMENLLVNLQKEILVNGLKKWK